MSVSESLRDAIREAIARGTTRYVISRDSGVDHSGLSRFMADGRDLRVSTVDRLAEFLHLELGPKNGVRSPE